MTDLKKLYGKTQIDSSDSEDIGKDYQIELEYYQLENQTARKPYGIEIVKRNIVNNILNVENKIIENIHKKERDNFKLLEILIANKVTPISLDDVLHDLL